MISLARQVYHRPTSDPGELTTLTTAAAVGRRLLDRFLPSVYGSDRTADQVGRWLAFLASRLPTASGDPNLYWWRLPRAVPQVVITALVTAIVTVLGAVLGLLLAVAKDTDRPGATVTVGALVGFAVGLVAGLHSARVAYGSERVPQGVPWWQTVATGLYDVYIVAAALSAAGASVLVAASWLAKPSATTASISVVDRMSALRGADPATWTLALLVLVGGVATALITNGLGAGGVAPRAAACPAFAPSLCCWLAAWRRVYCSACPLCRSAACYCSI